MSAERVTGSVTTGGWLDSLRFSERGGIPNWLGRAGLRVCERLGVMDEAAAVALLIVAAVLAATCGPDPMELLG